MSSSAAGSQELELTNQQAENSIFWMLLLVRR
jgi:hypothetical protein